MFDSKVYIERRKALVKQLSDGIILILGNTEVPMNYPSNTYKFRQDSNFLYFFGLDYPDLAGIIDVDEKKEIIFGNDIEIDDVIWMGPQPGMKEKTLKCGVENVLPFSSLGEFIDQQIKKGRKIHFLPPYRAENKIFLEQITKIPVSALKEKSSIQLVKAVIALRSVKDAFEIAEIEKAAAIGFKIHMAAFNLAKPGIYEREIAGVMEGIALSHGGMVSFPVILSIHGETLHNHHHDNLLKSGDMLLSDAGAETELHYASDFTRVIPVGGKFSQKQKEIYEIVLAANNTATENIKPGIPYKNIHLASAKVIAEGLKNLGLMKGDMEEAVNLGAHALFFPHGLGHMMGLDVHDMEDLGENYVGYDEEITRSDLFGTAYLRLGKRLQPGYVITNEPGIYFIPSLIDIWKNENKFPQFINYDKVNEYRDFGGIRLEDDILVTETGSRLLGKRLPITVAEIETLMG